MSGNRHAERTIADSHAVGHIPVRTLFENTERLLTNACISVYYELPFVVLEHISYASESRPAPNGCCRHARDLSESRIVVRRSRRGIGREQEQRARSPRATGAEWTREPG